MSPLESLLLELIPVRPTPADPNRMGDGPTEAFRRLEAERERWLLVHEVTAEEEVA